MRYLKMEENILEKFKESTLTSRAKVFDDTEIQIRQQDLEAKRIQNQIERQDMEQRKDYADRIFSMISIYLFFVLLILFLDGFCTRFNLGDTVLVTLLGTTTSTILGVFYFVAKYLFTKK